MSSICCCCVSVVHGNGLFMVTKATRFQDGGVRVSGSQISMFDVEIIVLGAGAGGEGAERTYRTVRCE